MSEETVEIPVTRWSRVTLVGVYDSPAMAQLSDGDEIVFRPSTKAGAPFRAGTYRVHAGWHVRDVLGRIPTACVGDYVYRVEPQ